MHCNSSKPNEFDERQLQLRNKFGFESFLMISGLLLLFGFLLDNGVVFESPFMMVVMMLLIAFCYFNVRCTLTGAVAERQMSMNSVFFPVMGGIWFVLLLLHILSRDSLDEIIYSFSMFLFFGTASAAVFWVRHKEKHAGKEK